MIYGSLNGQVFCKEGNELHNYSLPFSDRGLAYGDGVFTTARIQSQKVVLLDEHLARLWHSCLAIGLIDKQDTSFKARLEHSLRNELIKESAQHQLAVIKVIITAGSGGRGYSRLSISKTEKLTFDPQQINIIVQFHPYPTHYLAWQTKGVSVGIAKSQLGISPILAGIKHLNRLEQVLIRQELDNRSEQDLLVFNCSQRLIEASASNVFIFDEQLKLRTPTLSESGVNGLMRQQVIKHYDDVEENDITMEQLTNTRAMFICNAVMGIVPVHTFLGKTLDISPVHAIQQLHENLQPISPLIHYSHEK